MELGRAASLRAITQHFLGLIFEAGGYIGLPLMLVAAAFARRNWSEGWARSLVLVLIVAIVLSLGPFLVVGGRPIIPLPGLVVGALPLIGKALPVRLMLYAFLALAIITALWLSSGSTPRWVRVAAALVVVRIDAAEPVRELLDLRGSTYRPSSAKRSTRNIFRPEIRSWSCLTASTATA